MEFIDPPLPPHLQTAQTRPARKQDGRVYDPGPKTPGQRLLECPALPEATKQPLRAEHARLNPIRLKKRLETKLRNFFTVLGNLDRESTKADRPQPSVTFIRESTRQSLRSGFPILR